MFTSFERKMKKNIKNAINDWLEILKKSIDEKTPEDTKKLLWNNEIEKAKQVWDVLIWKVLNKTKYWIYVEYWVWTKKFNYNKPKWTIFYQWTWARMYTRWYDESKKEILTIIKKAIWTQ